MKKEVLIIHYNTPELTEATVRSIRKQCGSDWHVTIFDNSDRMPFWKPMENVSVIDNTKGQIIDFGEWLKLFPARGESEDSNWGSAKHCKSVDICFDLLPDGFVLMDSDVVLHRDFGNMVSDDFAWSGMVHCNTRFAGYFIERICPFLCWINVPMLREHGVRYFNPEKMWLIVEKTPDKFYDTGAWLLEEARRLNLPALQLRTLDGYIDHFRGGSWRKSAHEAHLWLARQSKYFI